MQVIGLIGYVDKYDYTINLAKAINLMGKSVLVVDATNDKKLKYVVPALDNIGNSYVTQYDGVDFAVGFDSLHDVENYLVEQQINIGLYDYLLIDIDDAKGYEYFKSRKFDKNYFFINTNMISVNKDKEIVKAIKVYQTPDSENKFTKVIYKQYMSRASENYFEKRIEEYELEFVENSYEIDENDQDIMANLDSQFSGMIGLKKHSRMYLSNLIDMTAEIVTDCSAKDVKKEISRRRE